MRLAPPPPALRAWAPVLAGPAAGGIIWLLPAPAGMAPAAHAVAGLAAWMAVWWLTAILPLAVTALLPLALLRCSAAPHRADRPAYADRSFFSSSAALPRRRDRARQLTAAPSPPRPPPAPHRSPRLVLALMLATGFASMWISNPRRG